MLVRDFMREIRRMVGDNSNELVSSEFLIQSINEEMRYAMSRFPCKQRAEYSPASDTNTISLDDLFGEGGRISIKRVYINGTLQEGVSGNEIERLVAE